MSRNWKTACRRHYSAVPIYIYIHIYYSYKFHLCRTVVSRLIGFTLYLAHFLFFFFLGCRFLRRLLHSVFREHINKTINSRCARLQYFVGHDFYRKNASIGSRYSVGAFYLLSSRERTCSIVFMADLSDLVERGAELYNLYSGEEGDDGWKV